MRALITGGAGFIGRALVARCLDAGAEIAVIDNLCAGTLANLEPFLTWIRFHPFDILDQDKLARVMTDFAPDTVFHLAAHHFIPFCTAHPRDTLRVNVEGTLAVLQEAARVGTRVAVIAATGAGYPSVSEALAETLPLAPVDIYGVSKAMAEEVAAFVAAQSSLKCVAARLFNAYGPYETNPHLIPEIVKALVRGDDLRLGNLHPKRDYVYVDDIADMLYRCATAPIDRSLTVNIGTGDEYSVQEVVDALARVLGRPIRISIDPARVRSVDKLHQRADTTLLEKVTGARPRTPLDEGLRRLAIHEGLLTV
jgi:UDP-glucose 4-epimerase